MAKTQATQLRKETQQLREEKQQLRKKEEQLREEKQQLRMEQQQLKMQGEPRRDQLLQEEEMQEHPAKKLKLGMLTMCCDHYNNRTVGWCSNHQVS